MSDEAKDQLAENDLRKQLDEEEGERWNLARRLEIATLEVERLGAENARLHKDKARLDWLDFCIDTIRLTSGIVMGRLSDGGIRAAIDAARKGEKG